MIATRAVAMHFNQYSKVMTSVKRALKKAKADKLKLEVSRFNLSPAFKHAAKSRMGKGKSKFSSFV